MSREAKMQRGLLCCGLVFTPLPLDLAGFDQLAQDVLDVLAAQAALEELLDVALRRIIPNWKSTSKRV